MDRCAYGQPHERQDCLNSISYLGWQFYCAPAHPTAKGLTPGKASVDDVVATMGEPAMRWQNPDDLCSSHIHGGRQALTPHGYWSDRTRNCSVLRACLTKAFFLVQPGMTKDQVLRILGPSEPSWTAYFRARDDWYGSALLQCVDRGIPLRCFI